MKRCVLAAGLREDTDSAGLFCLDCPLPHQDEDSILQVTVALKQGLLEEDGGCQSCIHFPCDAGQQLHCYFQYLSSGR